ncbi:hypothetical protein G6027_16185 [Dietzia sp. SLG310A2-38A2]|jgi:predicted DNA-binding protein|uniref:hypothetical protein n=1 Tax=Dietzia TaxID=37914 RepID=UPI0015CA5332|nr:MULTISPECIES: hypothetical protein [Dietzia]MBB1032388.1 hypothetical protein [Dietzia sp. SLG310A2-38A2]
MADKLPEGPKPPNRRKRSVFSDLSPVPQQASEPAAQDAPEPAVQNVPVEPQGASQRQGASKKKGWDRTGQVSVVLGKERHERLKSVWATNARTYDAIADLIREAIDEKLDRLER